MAVNQILLQSLPLRVPPDAWDVVYLRDVTSKIGSGATPRGGEKVYQPQGSSLIRSQNVYDHEFRKDGLVYIDDSEASKLSNVIVQPGDVLLNITGDSIARCCLVPEWVLPARVNQHVAIIRPTERLNSIYLQKYLSHPRIKAYMLGHDAGGTRKALTKGNIESFLIPLPPLPEQKAIAHILGTLDDKIELNQQMNRNLEAIAQAIFKSWFVDFDPVRAKLEGRSPAGMDAATAALFSDSFEDSPMGEIPRGWKAASLGDIITLYDSRRIPLSNRERAQRQGQYPYYGAASVMDYVDDYLFDGVYVLMGEDGSVIGDNDHPVIQYVWGKFWVNNHAHVLQGTNGISNEHLMLFLKQINICPYVTGAVQPKLNQGNLRCIPFVLPSPKVCDVFRVNVSRLYAFFRANHDQSRTLSTIRDTLLPKLMSGEIRVKEAEKILEDVA